MELEPSDSLFNIFSIFVMCIIIVAIIFTIVLMYDFNNAIHEDNNKYITIEGEVTDYCVFEDYIMIEFNDNKRYKINYQGDMDFTVNSKLIVKLEKCTYDGFLWESDKYWTVTNIIKVPTG